MKKLLYKICKPHHKYKINLVDVLLLIEHDDYSEFERRVLVSTMIIIALLLIYLIITGK